MVFSSILFQLRVFPAGMGGYSLAQRRNRNLVLPIEGVLF